MRLPVNQPRPKGLSVFVLAALTAGALGAPVLARQPAPPASVPASGPAADYPMVLGQPFVVDGVTYTPADTMNYDQVGYGVVEAAAGPGVSISHRTLPCPATSRSPR